LLASSAGKARRIGGSTSYNETLGGCRGKELAQLVAMRLAEIFSYRAALSVKELIDIQTDVSWPIPIDHYTDCGDFFELVTGSKGCPQDKTQRLHVLSVREDRITRRIRFFAQIPTESMLVDALTKVMLSGLLMTFLTSGYYRIQHADHKVRLRVMPGRSQYTEKDLETMGEVSDGNPPNRKRVTTTTVSTSLVTSIPVVIAFLLAEAAGAAGGLVKYSTDVASVPSPQSSLLSSEYQILVAAAIIAAVLYTASCIFDTAAPPRYAREANTQSPVTYDQRRFSHSGSPLAAADFEPGRFNWKPENLTCHVGWSFIVDATADQQSARKRTAKMFAVCLVVYAIAFVHGYFMAG
jgi:hypothetical protein